MPLAQITSQQQLDSILQDPNGPHLIVLDVYADWCNPCKVIAPVLEELDKTYSSRAKIFKINIESGFKQDVNSLPTIEFWLRNASGQRVKANSVVGANVPQIKEFMAKFTSNQPINQLGIPAEPKPKRQTGGYARACDLK